MPVGVDDEEGFQGVNNFSVIKLEVGKNRARSWKLEARRKRKESSKLEARSWKEDRKSSNLDARK